jgi:hypothetical protein
LNSLADPHAIEQERFLRDDQRKVVQEFVTSKELPARVDSFFVDAIRTLLEGFQPVSLPAEELLDSLMQEGPCDVETFKRRIDAIVTSYIRGKDKDRVRLIIQRADDQ